MNIFNKSLLILPAIMAFSIISIAQSLQLGEVIVTCNSPLKKDASSDAFSAYITGQVIPNWSVRGTSMHLFKADRGEKNGEFLLACTSNQLADFKKAVPAGSPFSDKAFSSMKKISALPSGFLSNPDSFTQYVLIGAKEIGVLPSTAIFGIHYIKVRKEMSGAFELFVRQKLHPAVTHLLPGLGLYYYKAMEGEYTGSYILIFAFESTGARNKCWPDGGGAETEFIKNAFLPLHDLAEELGTYLEEGSYLKPGGGGDYAAAYFESHVWTDYVLVK